MPEAIPELIWFALLLFLFAFVYVVRKLIEALFAPIIAALGPIPVVGNAIRGALGAVEQAISSALGTVEHKIDALIGASWHRFAELNLWLWRELKAHAQLIALISSGLEPLVLGYKLLRTLVHHFAHANTGTTAKVKQLEKEVHGIEHGVKQLEKDLSKGIGHDLRLHIKALEKELGHVENKTIPAIQSDVANADSAISNLYDWAKGKADLIGIGTFAAAIGVALSKLGLDWLRCKENPFNNNPNACALWGDLASLLGLAFVTAQLGDLDSLLEEAGKVTDEVTHGLADLLGVALPKSGG